MISQLILSMPDLLKKIMTVAMIAGAVLLVAACDRNVAENAAANIDLGNDMMLDADNMGLGVEMNAASDMGMDANTGSVEENEVASANGSNYLNGTEPSGNMTNGGGEADHGSGTTRSSDPRIARLCRSAGLTDPACSSLNNQFQNLEGGVGSLNAPAEMSLEGNYTAVLAIGREADQAVVEATAEAEAGPAATSEVGDVQLAQHMRVTLSGSAFRITPEGAAERELGISRQETWRWQVTPTAEGPQSLVATVTPIAVLPNGRRLELGPARRNLDVRVSVTAEQRMGRLERFVKSTTGILVAIAALIAAISLIVWRIRSFGNKPE